MELSKREKLILIGACAAVGIYALDYLVLTPWMQSLERIKTDSTKTYAKLDDAYQTIRNGTAASRRLRQVRDVGLPVDPSMTESKLLNAIRKWAQDSGITLVSLRPDRTSSSKGLSELSFQATGTGKMSQITKFLYTIETAKMPVRVHEVQIASKTEGTDDLTLQMHVSSLWEDVKPGEAVAQSQPKEQP